MNHKIILSYFLVMGFFVCLIFAYMKYSNSTLELETDKLRQNVVSSLEKEITNLQQQINELKSKTYDSNGIYNAPEQYNAIHDFIQNNPELIAKTLEDFYRSKTIAAQKNAIENNVKEIVNDINNGMFTTFAGKMDAPIKVFEFFDYSCEFCSKMLKVNNELLLANPDVMLVFIELPMLGPESFEATRVATAVSMIDHSKYLQFQIKLFSSQAPKDMDSLIDLARQVGIDPNALKQSLNKDIDRIEERMRKNSMIAKDIQLQGTPTYVIGDEILVGAVEQQKLTEAITRTRAKAEHNNK